VFGEFSAFGTGRKHYLQVFIMLILLFQDARHLSVTNVRTLKMNDDVLALSIGPTGKHIDVALLDCTVKVLLYLLIMVLNFSPHPPSPSTKFII
jgi:hypothetical protein